jgi:hypothetical protein
MTESRGRSGQWYLVLIAIVADIAGILTFVGFGPSGWIKLALAAVLALLGIAAAAGTLWTATKLYLSPRGSYYPSALHARRLLTGLAALVISLILGFVVVGAGVDYYRQVRSPAAPLENDKSRIVTPDGSLMMITGGDPAWKTALDALSGASACGRPRHDAALLTVVYRG